MNKHYIVRLFRNERFLPRLFNLNISMKWVALRNTYLKAICFNDTIKCLFFMQYKIYFSYFVT